MPTLDPEEVAALPESGSAKDDLVHRREQLAWLARVGNCLPEDRDLDVELEVYANSLLACVHVPTRRDTSVFFDDVTYACWSVDTKTGEVAKRTDLGRNYFECRDGSCPPGPTYRQVSYDGTRDLVLSADKPELSIVSHTGEHVVRSFPFKQDEPMRGGLTLVGGKIVFVDETTVRIFDEYGKELDSLPGVHTHVVDDDHVLAIGTSDDARLYELSTKKRTPVKLAEPYVEHAVRFGGTYYALDADQRRLITLDGKLQPTGGKALHGCP